MDTGHQFFLVLSWVQLILPENISTRICNCRLGQIESKSFFPTESLEYVYLVGLCTEKLMQPPISGQPFEDTVNGLALKCSSI
jgi:hypothetical protein